MWKNINAFKYITTENYPSSTVTYCNQCNIYIIRFQKFERQSQRESMFSYNIMLLFCPNLITPSVFFFLLKIWNRKKNTKENRKVKKNKNRQRGLSFFNQIKMEWNIGNYSAIRKDSSKYICWLYFLARALVYNHLVCWWYISTERAKVDLYSPNNSVSLMTSLARFKVPDFNVAHQMSPAIPM